jgi:hypothetical protein
VSICGIICGAEHIPVHAGIIKPANVCDVFDLCGDVSVDNFSIDVKTITTGAKSNSSGLLARNWLFVEWTAKLRWQIYFGDIHAGTVAERVGNPHDTDQWAWRCGFYPGSRPGEYQSGTAASFAEARADFERAWKIFLSKRTEADFQAWRDQRDWTERKYAMWERRERLPSQMPSSLMTCPCGEISLATVWNIP